MSGLVEEALKLLALLYGSLLLGALPFALLALALALRRRRGSWAAGVGPSQDTAHNPQHELDRRASQEQRTPPAQSPSATPEVGAGRVPPVHQGAPAEPPREPTPGAAGDESHAPPAALEEAGDEARLAYMERKQRLGRILYLREQPRWELYERTKEAVRAGRIARAQARARVRAALTPLSSRGFYVFEDLITEEAGAADQLAIGPYGLTVVVIRHEPGRVFREQDGRLGLLPYTPLDPGELEDPPPEPEDVTLRDPDELVFSPFEEDVERAANDLVGALELRLFGLDHPVPRRFAADPPVGSFLCFTNAFVPTSPNGTPPPGMLSVIDLAYALTYMDGRAPVFEEREIEYFAEVVADAYGREPWIRPDTRKASKRRR